MWIRKKQYEALLANWKDTASELRIVKENFYRFIDDAEKRIGELEESYKRGSLKSDEPESVQIDPGHVPFSQRKRNFEATKRQEAASKKKGPQPAKGT